MLFGQSVFQSVLTRLDEEDAVKTEADPQAFRVSGLNASFVAETAVGSPTSAADAYFDVQADGMPAQAEATDASDAPAPVPQPPEEPEIPPHLLRLSEAEIAEDLAIGPEDTAETLAEKRRRFAKDNHPDTIAVAFRDEATLRMTTANLLVDRAIKDLYWRSS
jgi:hypothetical protein